MVIPSVTEKKKKTKEFRIIIVVENWENQFNRWTKKNLRRKTRKLRKKKNIFLCTNVSQQITHIVSPNDSHTQTRYTTRNCAALMIFRRISSNFARIETLAKKSPRENRSLARFRVSRRDSQMREIRVTTDGT